jgi:hypothetical protein
MRQIRQIVSLLMSIVGQKEDTFRKGRSAKNGGRQMEPIVREWVWQVGSSAAYQQRTAAFSTWAPDIRPRPENAIACASPVQVTLTSGFPAVNV